MKDLLEKIIPLIPAYISQFLALVSGPKRFVARLASQDELSVEKGLTFLGVSFAIGWMLTASHSGPELFLELAKDAAFTLASVVGFGGAICLAWRVVGGREAVQRVFAIHLYYSGVVEVVMAATFLVIMGLIRSDGNLYKMVNDAATSGRWFSFLQDNQDWLLASRTVRSALLLLLVGVAVGAAWIFAGWGAYRQVNRLTKLRSAFAVSLFVLFCFPVMGVTYLIANAVVKRMPRPTPSSGNAVRPPAPIHTAQRCSGDSATLAPWLPARSVPPAPLQCEHLRQNFDSDTPAAAFEWPSTSPIRHCREELRRLLKYSRLFATG